jgi:hypothetical protein
MCISESYVKSVSTQQWPRWCFQQKGFMNTQWHRNLCLVISKRLVQTDFKLFTVHCDIGTESYQWPMAATVLHIKLPSRCSTWRHKTSGILHRIDWWLPTLRSNVMPSSSGSSSLTSDFFRRLGLENENVYQFTRCDILEVLNLQPQLYENRKSLVLSLFHFDYWKLLLTDGLMLQQFVFLSSSMPLVVDWWQHNRFTIARYRVRVLTSLSWFCLDTPEYTYNTLK